MKMPPKAVAKQRLEHSTRSTLAVLQQPAQSQVPYSLAGEERLREGWPKIGRFQHARLVSW